MKIFGEAMTGVFFQGRLDQMIDLRHPLAVLRDRIHPILGESGLAQVVAHRNRHATSTDGMDMLGVRAEIAGQGVSAAGRPRLPVSLMASQLYRNDVN